MNGGGALTSYDEFKKIEIVDGRYRVTNRRTAMRHRMHIGTIVSEPMMKVKMISGGYVGVIEEYFISKLNPGDVFTLAGRNLELLMVKNLTAIVRKSSSKKSKIPSWQGGRMPLSANLGSLLRKQIGMAGKKTKQQQEELISLRPLFDLQSYLSHIPDENELLIEQIETKDGFHVFAYPFEGRLVHEALSAIIAYRLSKIMPISFSLAMNDYGFELLSDRPIPLDDGNAHDIFSLKNLAEDIQNSLNSIEMAKRKFRDIATIGGLIFQGFPGETKRARHLQSSAGLLFDVISEYDPHNLLIRQAYHEAMEQQMQEERLRNALKRIHGGKIIITFPRQLTPFCFPIKVDSMRENLTSEKLEDRIRRMLGRDRETEKGR
jgi:ATP-dependent Lhr-like helicase